MKLQSSKQKQKKMLIIIGVAILAVALIAGLVIGIISLVKNITGGDENLPEQPLATIGINVSSFPDKMEYFVGEACDWTGLRVQVVMNKQSESYFVGVNQVEITGFDSSVANDKQVITVTYEGYSTTFTVKIKENPAEAPKRESLKLDEAFKSTFTMDEWNNTSVLNRKDLIVVYTDGSEEKVPMSLNYVVGGSLPKVTQPGEVSFTIQYKGLETTITVTITE